MYDSPTHTSHDRQSSGRRALAPTVIVAALLTAAVGLASLGPAVWAFLAGVLAGSLAAWATVRRVATPDGETTYHVAGLNVEVVVSTADRRS